MDKILPIAVIFVVLVMTIIVITKVSKYNLNSTKNIEKNTRKYLSKTRGINYTNFAFHNNTDVLFVENCFVTKKAVYLVQSFKEKGEIHGKKDSPVISCIDKNNRKTETKNQLIYGSKIVSSLKVKLSIQNEIPFYNLLVFTNDSDLDGMLSSNCVSLHKLNSLISTIEKDLSKQKKELMPINEKLDLIEKTSITKNRDDVLVDMSKIDLNQFDIRYDLLVALRTIYTDVKYKSKPKKDLTIEFLIPSEKLIVEVKDDISKDSIPKGLKNYSKVNNFDIIYWNANDKVDLKNIVKYNLINRR